MELVGFSGSRFDLPDPQADALVTEAHALNGLYKDLELHHGDCTGADLFAHHMAKGLRWRVVAHPAIIHVKWKAMVRDADEYRIAQRPIRRNHTIVEETRRVIACPSTFTPTPYSGTWATIRYARKLKRPLTVILPDGETFTSWDLMR